MFLPQLVSINAIGFFTVAAKGRFFTKIIFNKVHNSIRVLKQNICYDIFRNRVYILQFTFITKTTFTAKVIFNIICKIRNQIQARILRYENASNISNWNEYWGYLNSHLRYSINITYDVSGCIFNENLNVLLLNR